MHVFLSDLHLTDWELGSPVTDAELTTFCKGQLGDFCRKGEVKLILLGDVVDLLRSAKWAELWNQRGGAPWKGQGPDFSGFNDDYGEEYALQVAQGIAARYPDFSAALKSLVETGKLKVFYTYGNHDFMAQLSPKIREILRDFLSLAQDPVKPFPLVYTDEESSIYAMHGHSFDPLNWHRVSKGYWAFGDAIVLRIVNRFAAEACRELGVKETSQLGRRLHELDNIEPTLDIPVYVRWLTDQALSIKSERTKIRQVWDRVVNDFLQDDVFQDDRAYSDRAFKTTRMALSISTSDTLIRLVEYVSSLLPEGINYHQEADQLARAQDKYRFIVFGHTHHPGILPLSHSVGKQPAFYVNTGCWRRVVTRPSRAAPGPFIGTRVASSFWIDDAAATNAMGRYHLARLCHTT
ncbi:MAG TPA: hypothetical protein VH682_08450 [Gemmataceae bacterium]|jgi:UDP-2,3-diacylglucosamine pyrophosphatase LpxH